MSSKDKKTDDITLMLLKLEVAKEMGLIDKVKEVGWGGLTAEETGKIGGYMTQKLRTYKNKT